MDKSPSLIDPPITGTTVLIKNLTDLMPKISLLEDTAVLIDKTETNIAETKAIEVVSTRLTVAKKLAKLSSLLSPEHTLIAKKELIIGIKIFAEINDNPCANINSEALVENVVSVPPPIAIIEQNAGINA